MANRRVNHISRVHRYLILHVGKREDLWRDVRKRYLLLRVVLGGVVAGHEEGKVVVSGAEFDSVEYEDGFSHSEDSDVVCMIVDRCPLCV